jgi:hypothetical protein
MNQPNVEETLIDDLIPDDQQEDESDLDDKKISFKDAVVMNADWTIETINSQVNKGNIDLDPGFQRRSAWDDIRQSRLIESMIVGMPIPNIVLAENKSNRGRFIVIDGKQRLLTINDFMADHLTLRGLDIRTDLNGKKLSTLEPSDREYLENSTLRSTVIKNWVDENFLFTIFFRLNSGSLPLSPQELRKALIGNKLLQAIEEFIANSDPFHQIFGVVPDKRMRDSELVLRFIAFDRSYEAYNGNLKDLLDDTTKFYEEDWDNRFDDLKIRFERLNRALSTSYLIFNSDSFKKWLGTGYERRINRAIFDCLIRFFAEEHVANLALANQPAVIEAYKRVCLTPAFKDAIEKTTKSQSATRSRVGIWGAQLAATLNLGFDQQSARLG